MQSKVKPMQSRITFDIQLNIALKGTFTKRCYLYRRRWSSLQDRHFTEKFLQLFVFGELHCWNTFAVHANNQSHVTVVRYIISKKPEKWKPNKYFLVDCLSFILSNLLYFILAANPSSPTPPPPRRLMSNPINAELLTLLPRCNLCKN